MLVEFRGDGLAIRRAAARRGKGRLTARAGLSLRSRSANSSSGFDRFQAIVHDKAVPNISTKQQSGGEFVP